MPTLTNRAPFTWDDIIARGEHLSRNHPPAQELLSLLVQITKFQRDVSLGLASMNGGCTGVQSILRLIPQLQALLDGLASQPLREALSELGSHPAKWTELLSRFEEQSFDEDSPSRTFLAYLLMQPYAQHVTDKHKHEPEAASPHCPVCRNRPLVSLLREYNQGAKRSLFCSMCFTEWEFQRTRCTACGEEDHDKLPIYKAEQVRQARIEACDTCMTYAKCIDLSRDGHAVPPADDLATLALDVWAHEQGYRRLQPNILLL